MVIDFLKQYVIVIFYFGYEWERDRGKRGQDGGLKGVELVGGELGY